MPVAEAAALVGDAGLAGLAGAGVPAVGLDVEPLAAGLTGEPLAAGLAGEPPAAGLAVEPPAAGLAVMERVVAEAAADVAAERPDIDFPAVADLVAVFAAFSALAAEEADADGGADLVDAGDFAGAVARVVVLAVAAAAVSPVFGLAVLAARDRALLEGFGSTSPGSPSSAAMSAATSLPASAAWARAGVAARAATV
jgi:hypothetical protein